MYLGQPFPKGQTLDFSKLKEIADDNFKFYKNGGKFSERVENSVEKGKNCLSQAIIPFSTEFSKDLYCRHIKTRACLRKGLRRTRKV